MKEIIQRLEAKRIELGLTHQDVADLDEKMLSKSTVWKTLTGNSEPDGKTLFALAKALGFVISMKEIKKLKKIETVAEEVHKDGGISLESHKTEKDCGCYIENNLLKRSKNSRCKLTKEEHKF